MITRRALVEGLCAAALVGGKAAAESPSRSARDDLLLWAKLTADLSGRTVYALTVGTVWGFKPQADDVPLADFARRLYGYHSLVARKARRDANGAIVIKQQTWTFYQEPQGYTFVRELTNPYTGAVDRCPPMSAPATELVYTTDGLQLAHPPFPVEQSRPARPFDLRIARVGKRAVVDEAGFTRLQPGGIDWWKLEGQLISHVCAAAALDRPGLSHIPNTWSHNLVAEWQTWMRMHGVPGHILFKGEGGFVVPADLPGDLKTALETYFPGQLAAVRGWG